MWNGNLHYKLIQKGAGNYEDSEESEVSSQGTESSQEETEAWSIGHAYLMKPRNAIGPRSTQSH